MYVTNKVTILFTFFKVLLRNESHKKITVAIHQHWKKLSLSVVNKVFLVVLKKIYTVSQFDSLFRVKCKINCTFQLTFRGGKSSSIKKLMRLRKPLGFLDL